MRDRMERFTIFPFSAGCVSQSSVAVGKAEAEPSPAPSVSQSSGKMKSSFGLLPLPRPNIAAGIQRVIKSLKSLSSIFVFDKEDDEEIEMEIGFPTDVQHVAHIGWDGMSSGNSLKSWDRGAELLSLPSLSLRQFELAMAAQAKVPQAHGPL